MEEQNNQGQADSAQSLPVKQQAQCDCFSAKKLCPWGMLIFIVAFIVGLWLWTGNGSKDPVFSFVPASSYKVDTFNCDGRALEHLAALPLFNNEANADREILTGFLGVEFPELKSSEKWQEVLPLVQTATKAFTAEGTLYALTSGNSWQIEQIITEQIAQGFNRDRDSLDILNIKKIYKLKVEGIGTVYLGRINQTVLLTRSEGLMKSAVYCYRGQEDSLAGIGLSWPEDESGRIVRCRYEVPAVANSYFTGINESSFRKNAALFTVCSVTAAGFVQQTRVINDSAIESASGHGVFYYLGMFIMTILALVIGLPALFILIVVLMAVYFHIVAWIKGEIVPIEPPEIPELSPELKEDMGGEIAQKADGAKENQENPQ